MPNIDADPIHIDRRIQKINAKKEEIFAVDSPYATKDYVDQKAGTSGGGGGGGGGGSSSGATGIGSSIRDAIDWSVIKRTNKFYQVDNGLVICYAIDAKANTSSVSTVYKSWVFYPNRDENGFVSHGFRCFYSVDCDPNRTPTKIDGKGSLNAEGLELFKELYQDQFLYQYDSSSPLYAFGINMDTGESSDDGEVGTTRKKYCAVINSPVCVYSLNYIYGAYAYVSKDELSLTCSFPSFTPILTSYVQDLDTKSGPSCFYSMTSQVQANSRGYNLAFDNAYFLEQNTFQIIDKNTEPYAPFINGISVYNLLGTDTTNAALIPDAVKENTHLLEWS